MTPWSALQEQTSAAGEASGTDYHEHPVPVRDLLDSVKEIAGSISPNEVLDRAQERH